MLVSASNCIVSLPVRFFGVCRSSVEARTEFRVVHAGVGSTVPGAALHFVKKSAHTVEGFIILLFHFYLLLGKSSTLGLGEHFLHVLLPQISLCQLSIQVFEISEDKRLLPVFGQKSVEVIFRVDQRVRECSGSLQWFRV